MPTGPHPTAFGEPDPPGQRFSPRYPRPDTNNSSIPAYSAPTGELDRSAETTYTSPPGRPPARSTSPAPSYHTLPPNTHASLSPNPAQTPPHPTLPATAPLLAAARDTPDAILSHLTITNHVSAGSSAPSSRSLIARTADGKARYHVTAPSSTEAVVLKVLGPTVEVAEEIARVSFTSRGLRVVDIIMEGGKRVERGVLEVGYEELERRGGLDVGMRVQGRESGVRWEVVRREEGERDGGGGRRKSSDKGLGGRGRFASDEHERRRQKAALDALRLEDREGSVYAEYSHEVGLPSPNKEERWGQVSLRSRAVLLDEGVDRAFVTLVALLECYVRIFGQSKREHRDWGNLAGSMACSVM